MPKGTIANLRCFLVLRSFAFFCEHLRFSPQICASQMLVVQEEGRIFKNQHKSARFGLVCPSSSFPSARPEYTPISVLECGLSLNFSPDEPGGAVDGNIDALPSFLLSPQETRHRGMPTILGVNFGRDFFLGRGPETLESGETRPANSREKFAIKICRQFS